MTREQSLFIMLDSRRADRPLYRQIYEAIRMAILSGEFGPGKRLAATRALARELGVSRITVLNAYEQLFAEGYLDGKGGAGTFVTAELPDNLLKTETIKQSKQKKTNAPLRLSPFGEKLAAKDVGSIRAWTIAKVQPFQNGLTAVDKFPFEVWSRIAARLHRNPLREVLAYGHPQGSLPFR